MRDSSANRVKGRRLHFLCVMLLFVADCLRALMAGDPPQPSPTPELSIYKTDPRWIWWNQQRARDRAFEWKMPIDFFGKAIDEAGAPVPGATVTFSRNDTSPAGTSTATTLSDVDGSFALRGVHGKRLIVNVTAPGYYASQRDQTSFEYAAFFESNFHQPDSQRPVIFRLRKRGQVHPALIVREALMSVDPTGEPQFIDLLTTHKTSNGRGHIAVRLTRPASQPQPYEWSAAIDGVNGAGLLESEEEFMFQAPLDGYLPGYSYSLPDHTRARQTRLEKKYYVRATDGAIWGRLEIEFIPTYQRAAAIRIRFFINRDGSRNLEWEPNAILPETESRQPLRVGSPQIGIK